MFLKKIDHGESESVIGFRFGLIVYELDVPKMDPYVDKEQYEQVQLPLEGLFRSLQEVLLR
jgi:hypothetical protein